MLDLQSMIWRCRVPVDLGGVPGGFVLVGAEPAEVLLDAFSVVQPAYGPVAQFSCGESEVESCYVGDSGWLEWCSVPLGIQSDQVDGGGEVVGAGLAMEVIDFDAPITELDTTIEARFRRHYQAMMIIRLPRLAIPPGRRVPRRRRRSLPDHLRPPAGRLRWTGTRCSTTPANAPAA
jgi:hypothetical protein